MDSETAQRLAPPMENGGGTSLSSEPCTLSLKSRQNGSGGTLAVSFDSSGNL